jgi:peptidoglycan hydrolase-like protein with peptidoglycan-binding domain
MSDDVMDVGVENTDVLDAQDRLRFLGYYHGHVSGSFDSATGEAVRSFQQAAGAADTGTLDAAGLQHLREYSDAYHYGHGATHADYDSHPGPSDHQHGHGHGHGHGHEQGGSSEWADEVVHGTGTLFDWRAVETLNNIETHANYLAKVNDDAFIRSCTEFQHYVEAQAQFQEDIDALGAHVAMQVARSVCDAVGIYLCGLAWPEISYVVEQISMGIAHSTSKISYSYMATHDANEIRKFWKGRIVEIAHELATLHEQTHREVRKKFDVLRQQINAHQPLDPADIAWLSRCMGSGGTDWDEAVESLFGIRRESRVWELERDVYGKLVEEFLSAYYDSKAEAAKESSSTFFPDHTPSAWKEAERFANDPERLKRRAVQDAVDGFAARRHHQ